MKYKLLLLALTLCLTMLAAAQAARDFLPAGTLLKCTMDEPNFSSKTAQVGDPVLCHLGSAASFGHPVFPRGAYLSGHLQDYQDPGHFWGKGWMEIDFDRLVLPGENILPLSAKLISVPHYKVDREGKIHGKGHPVRDTVEWMIPPLWPVKVINLPRRGPFPTLKGEVRMTMRLMEDVEVPRLTASNVPMPPWATTGSLTQPSQQLWRGQADVRPADYRPVSQITADDQPQVIQPEIIQAQVIHPETSQPETSQPQITRSPEPRIIRSAAYYAQQAQLRQASLHQAPVQEPAQQEPVPQEPMQQVSVQQPARQPTLLVLNDSSAVVAQDYWIEADHVRCVTRDSEDKLIPLTKIDLDQTVRLNRERNVDFTLRSKDTTEH